MREDAHRRSRSLRQRPPQKKQRLPGILRHLRADPENRQLLLGWRDEVGHVVERLVVARQGDLLQTGGALGHRHREDPALAGRNVGIERSADKLPRRTTRGHPADPAHFELLAPGVGRVRHPHAHRGVGGAGRIRSVRDQLHAGIGEVAGCHRLDEQLDALWPLVGLQRIQPAARLQIADEHDLAGSRRGLAFVFGEHLGRRDERGGAGAGGGHARHGLGRERLKHVDVVLVGVFVHDVVLDAHREVEREHRDAGLHLGRGRRRRLRERRGPSEQRERRRSGRPEEEAPGGLDPLKPPRLDPLQSASEPRRPRGVPLAERGPRRVQELRRRHADGRDHATRQPRARVSQASRTGTLGAANSRCSGGRSPRPPSLPLPPRPPCPTAPTARPWSG